MKTPSPMKIVHSEASVGWGGQEIRILEEARGLIARGHDITLLGTANSRILAEAPRFGVPATALPIGRKRLPGLLAMRRWLADHQPDIINTHSSTDSWLAGLASATLAQPPAIVRTRHISAPISVSPSSRWLYGRSAHHVVTTGEALRQTLIKTLGLPPDNVTSVPTGIDTERFTPGDKVAAKRSLGLDIGRRYIGIVATLRSWKGHLYLLDAFAKLDLADWTLLIIGEGPMLDNITAKANELKLRQRIIFAGQRSDPEMWLRALDIFCLPSYANEGVPQSIMQAMLTGLPIVTTPVGAILEAVRDDTTALVVPPQDADALAAAIARLISDEALAQRLASAARDYALLHFSQTGLLDQMESIFQKVIQDRTK